MGFFMFYRLKNTDAYDALMGSLEALREGAESFAAEYEAYPIILQNTEGYWLDSLEFMDPIGADPSLWTAPDRKTRGQRPRNTAPMPRYVPALDRVWKEWDARIERHLPRGTVVSKIPFYNSLGLQRGPVKCFKFEGVVYLRSEVDAIIEAVEIGANEYWRAKDAQGMQSYTCE